MDPNKLPKDLGSQDPITSAKLKALWANLPLNMGIPQLDGLSLQKGTVVFQPDPSLKFTGSRNGATADFNTKNFALHGLLNYNGGWQASADGHAGNMGINGLINSDGLMQGGLNYPLLGGLLSGSITHGPSGNSYGIQYQRNF